MCNSSSTSCIKETKLKDPRYRQNKRLYKIIYLRSYLVSLIRWGLATYFCTIKGLVLGIWLHLLTTEIPVPLAKAGGLTIHLARQPRFSQTFFSNLVSAGRQKVLGKKENSSLPYFRRSLW